MDLHTRELLYAALGMIEPNDPGSHNCNKNSDLVGVDVAQVLAEGLKDIGAHKLHYAGLHSLDTEDIAADKCCSFGFDQAETVVAIEQPL